MLSGRTERRSAPPARASIPSSPATAPARLPGRARGGIVAAAGTQRILHRRGLPAGASRCRPAKDLVPDTMPPPDRHASPPAALAPAPAEQRSTPRGARWLKRAGWGVLAAFVGLQLFGSLSRYVFAPPPEFAAVGLGWRLAVALLESATDLLMPGASLYLGLRYPLERRRWRRRLPRYALTLAGLMALIVVADLTYLHAVGGSRHSLAGVLRLQPLVFAVFAGAGHGVHALLARRRERLAALQLGAQLAEAESQRTLAELRALRASISPRVLFDALGAIGARIPHDAAGANRLLVRLSELLRHVLGVRDAASAPLEDELRALQAVVELQAAALGSAAELEVEAEAAALELPMPRLLLEQLAVASFTALQGGRPARVSVSAALRGRRLRLRFRLDLDLPAASWRAAPLPESDDWRRAGERARTLGAELELEPSAAERIAWTLLLPLAPVVEPASAAAPGPPSELHAPPAAAPAGGVAEGGRWVYLLPLGFFVVFWLALYSPTGMLVSPTVARPRLAAVVLPTAMAGLWSVILLLAFWLTRRAPLWAPWRPGRVTAHLGGALLSGLLTLTMRLLPPAVLGAPSAQPRPWYGRVLAYALIYLILVSLAHAVEYARGAAARERATLQLRARLARAQQARAEAELRALDMELNPHFLFNALHSVSALLYSDAAAAREMLARLERLLQWEMAPAPTPRARLADELELIRLYLAIEQVRFGERLRVVWEVAPEALDAEVPRLVLQPLVENAIKHAAAPRAATCTLWIGARPSGDDLRLEVRDDGPGLSANGRRSAGQGIGLANTRERLAHLFGEAARVELTSLPEGGVRAALTFPLRRAPAEPALPATR